jgi:hypothetical protein
MTGKIKTSILIEEDIWEMFKAKASSKKLQQILEHLLRPVIDVCSF